MTNHEAERIILAADREEILAARKSLSALETTPTAWEYDRLIAAAILASRVERYDERPR